MTSGNIKDSSLKRPKTTVYFVCKYCRKTSADCSFSSSTASSKVPEPETKGAKILNMTSGASGSGRRSSDTAKWSSPVEHAFVDLMYEQVLKGNIYTTTFSPLVWSDIRSALFEMSGTMFDIKQLKGKHARLKETWRKYHDLMVAETGIGWNLETNMPQAEPIIWEELTKTNPIAAELRYKGFPHYVKLDIVFSGRAATGANARASTQMPTPSRPAAGLISDDEGIDLGSPDVTTPSCNNTRGTMSGGKRKAVDNNAIATLVESINFANTTLAEKAIRREAWSVEKVVAVLKSFEDLDRRTFNLALRHFREDVNRRIFMTLSTEDQRDYIEFNILNK